MSFKTILKKLDITAECRKYGLGFWQCPNSLFLVMGVIIIGAMIATYFIGIHFVEPEAIIAIVSAATIILLIVGHSLVTSFARIAEANKMKSEFVSIVSHQLRTPLSSLKWSLSLLQGKRIGSLNEKQKEYINIIVDSNNRMIKLVNDLLNVSRIEQKRLETKPKAFSIGKLIQETIQLLKPLAQSRNVNINFKDSGNLPQVYADQDKIQMVIQNLIDNAVKYSKKQNGLVEINAEVDESNKGVIKISVKDNGIGIANFLRKQIFGKFFRADGLVKQKTQGAGLGLFITKGIIKASKGKIDFESKEGEGSVFWFTLPIAKDNN